MSSATDEFKKLSEQGQREMLIHIGKTLISRRKWNEYFTFLHTLCSNNVVL